MGSAGRRCGRSAHDGAGKRAIQWRAISSRRQIHTRSWARIYSIKRISALARPGWPVRRICSPTDIMRGRSAPFFVEQVEAVAQKGKEILARAEHAAAEFGIVGGQRIGYDQMRLLADPHPIGQFVIVGVAVVEKAAMLDDQPAGVFGRRIAAVPAEPGSCRWSGGSAPTAAAIWRRSSASARPGWLVQR